MSTADIGYTLITGATSGIGYELAKLFAEDDHDLIIVARHEEELEDTATKLAHYGISIVPIAVDLSLPEGPFYLYEQVKQKNLSVEILVNDAGQANYGKFAKTDLQKDIADIQLNVTSVIVLTKLFLQDMLAQNKGRILELASLASLYPAPLEAVYGGTKAFVLSFTEALRNELKDTAVTVTALLPGPTDTDFFNKAGAENTHMAQDMDLSDPAKVARDGYKALMRGEGNVVSGLKNKLMAGLSHILPESANAAAMRMQTEPTRKNKE